MHEPTISHRDHGVSSLNFGISRNFPSKFANRVARNSSDHVCEGRWVQGGLLPASFPVTRSTVHLYRERVWFVGLEPALSDSAINNFVRKPELSRPRGSNPEPVVYKTDR